MEAPKSVEAPGQLPLLPCLSPGPVSHSCRPFVDENIKPQQNDQYFAVGQLMKNWLVFVSLLGLCVFIIWTRASQGQSLSFYCLGDKQPFTGVSEAARPRPNDL